MFDTLAGGVKLCTTSRACQ